MHKNRKYNNDINYRIELFDIPSWDFRIMDCIAFYCTSSVCLLLYARNHNGARIIAVYRTGATLYGVSLGYIQRWYHDNYDVDGNWWMVYPQTVEQRN